MKKACSYVTLGVFQSEPVENECGEYRQLSGGSYFVTLEQVLSSAFFRGFGMLSKYKDM